MKNESNDIIDIIHDNIMEDCGMKDVNFVSKGHLDFEDIFKELLKHIKSYKAFNWSFNDNEKIKPSFKCANLPEGIALTLYFKYTDEVKERIDKGEEK